MYVCLCNAVTDHQIRAEIRQGACTLHELRKRLGVANHCGRCGQCARAILTEHAMDEAQQGVIIETDAMLPAQA
ncbi:MAG: bacterioferritin-associated ferredoxin [Gammaproteobacteria bacterium]